MPQTTKNWNTTLWISTVIPNKKRLRIKIKNYSFLFVIKKLFKFLSFNTKSQNFQHFSYLITFFLTDWDFPSGAEETFAVEVSKFTWIAGIYFHLLFLIPIVIDILFFACGFVFFVVIFIPLQRQQSILKHGGPFYTNSSTCYYLKQMF